MEAAMTLGALSLVCDHGASIPRLLNEVYCLRVAKGLSPRVAPWLVTLR